MLPSVVREPTSRLIDHFYTVHVQKVQAEAVQTGWLKHVAELGTMCKISKNTQFFTHISYASDDSQLKFIERLTRVESEQTV